MLLLASLLLLQMLRGLSFTMALDKFIIAECNAGMANRLRALAYFMFYAHDQYDGSSLVFVWDVNAPCPGHFLDIYEPIPNVHFITTKDRKEYEAKAAVVFNNTR